MPFTNSYIFKSNLGPRFKEELLLAVNNVVQTRGFDAWWGPNPHQLHLTIASGDGIKERKKTLESWADIEKRNKAVEDGMAKVLAAVSKSIFMIPHNIRVSKTGFIILEFTPAPMNSEELKTLQELHNRFVTLGQQHKMVFNLDFCFNNFRPHVSIGKVKTNVAGRRDPTAEEVKAACEKIEGNKNKILASLDIDKVRMLNIYDFEVSYSLPLDDKFADYKRSALGDCRVLAKKTLPPRDFDIVAVAASKGRDEFVLQFGDAGKAKQCAEFLFQLGIAGKKGTIVTPKEIQANNSLILNRQEYLKIAGMIKKCLPSIAETMPSLSLNKPSTDNKVVGEQKLTGDNGSSSKSNTNKGNHSSYVPGAQKTKPLIYSKAQPKRGFNRKMNSVTKGQQNDSEEERCFLELFAQQFG